ncbi:BatD family protein [Flavobacterium amniphilum]|uniref:BatD family protein n=1 Tax=Flavobacterium amniphilum TaxID=1834035 RepID=UPI00202AA6E3|nr:BatD family protein [Flavobacterium amniphilum]MCL9805925.1 BatD family protein [Flavobacterium amniphilum]
MRRLLFILLLLSFRLSAQVQFDARVSADKMGINETVQVNFIMNDDGDNFNYPAFDGFEVVMGPSQTVNFAYNNGRKSFQKTYSFILHPLRKGVLIIKPATIEIRNRIYKTNPIKITVGNAVQNDDYNTPYAKQLKQQKKSEQVFLVADISNPNPYLNERVTITYKLFVGPQAEITGYSSTGKDPQYKDFWSQVEKNDNPQPKNQTVNGQDYRYVDLTSVVLYPQKSGKFTIDPLLLNVELNVIQGFDIFGDPVGKPMVKRFSTGSKVITVKPLPESNKPESFTGAVGNFDFQVVPSRTQLKAGESFDLKIVASGKGNLKLFTLPKPVVPSALEMYEPAHKENIQTSVAGMSGNVADTYTIIPQKKGEYVIDPITFTYFDPSTNQYKTISSGKIKVDVAEGNVIVNNDAETSATKTEVKANTTFGFIKTKTELSDKNNGGFLGSGLFYALLFIPFLLVPVLVVFRKRKDASDADVTGNRIKLSNKLAKKYLSEAQKQLANKEPFYIALERALHNFLKAKLHLETFEMSKDKIKELLLVKKADPDTVNQFIALVESCEFARYAPSTGASLQNDYNLAVSIISELEKQLV